MKRQPTQWEKIFANVINKGSVSKINSSISKPKQKPNNLINKWTGDLNRHFFKEDIQMARRHMQRYSILLNIREMQVKTTMKYHLISHH